MISLVKILNEAIGKPKAIILAGAPGASKGYSDYSYDLQAATNNGVIYPSVDPMVFEMKYPQQDIIGRVVPL